MLIKNKITFYFTFLMVFAGSSLFGQMVSSDSTFVERSKGNAIAVYNSAIKDQSLLFNGVEYKGIPEPYDGFPFFNSEYVEEGSIRYDDELYQNIPMQYDLVHDLLIVEHYDQKGYVSMIKPHQSKISSFDLLGHTFINIVRDSTSGVLRDGFYDLLYDGNTKVLAKRKKNKHEDISVQMIKVSFLEKNNYYLVKDGKYYPVKSKGSMLKVLKDQRKPLNQFASKNKVIIDFAGNRENAMVQLATYYDQIQGGE